MLIIDRISKMVAIKPARTSFFSLLRSFIFLLSLGVILSSTIIAPAVSAQELASSASSSAEATISADGLTELLDPAGLGAPAVDSKAYVLYDAQSGTFLLGKNQDTPLSPASTTKVMTVLLALENLELTDTITITREMFEGIPNDYTRLGLFEGEEITVEEALYACLLISANDAAMALAVKTGGSEAEFVKMMNDKAVELGCLNTNFTNSYGLADPNHLTTAHDMALILAEALKNDTYTRISTTKFFLLRATNKSEETRGMMNGNKFISTQQYAYDYYIGGKTGYTNISGYTIVAGAQKDGRTLISAIFGASGSEIRFSNLVSLFDFGFSEFSTVQVNPDDFEDLKAQAIAEVTSSIAEAGYDLEVANVRLNLNAFTTVASSRIDDSYECCIDMSKAAVQASPENQVLEYPLFRQYGDGTKSQVGVLEVSISKIVVAETTDDHAESSKPGFWTILFRIIVIIFLIAVLVICLLILYAMLRKDLNRFRKHRGRRIRLENGRSRLPQNRKFTKRVNPPESSDRQK